MADQLFRAMDWCFLCVQFLSLTFFLFLWKNEIMIIYGQLEIPWDQFNGKVQWRNFALKTNAVPAFCLASLISSVLTVPPLLPLRCSSKKQPVLSALPATEPSMDSTAPGSSGAFSFLVRPLCHPYFHGGSQQSSAPLFPLTACLLWPYPTQGPWGLPKGVESAS